MPSSKTSIDNRDIYYRLGKSAGYRARSAFKLLHLDEDFDLFSGVETAVDLCAAPGSWSQVLADKMEDGLLKGTSKVVSVDLQPMAPLPNVTTLQADITLPSTVPLVLEALGGRKADLVVCDGAPDVTGVHDLDAYLHSQLILAALTLALTLLAPGGTLIFKIFVSPLDPYAMMIKSQLRPFFLSPDDFPSGSPSSAGCDRQGRRGGIWNRKPRSSRPGSGEQFVVCRNFNAEVVPLPGLFSAESLEAMKAQTSGTLSLDSLADLAGTSDLAVGQDWRMIKAYAESGDLNPMADDVEDPASDHAPPNIRLPKKAALTLDTQSNRSAPSPLVTGPTPRTAQPETPVTASSSSTVFLSPQKIPSDGTSPTTRSLRDRAHLFIRGGPSLLGTGTSTQSSMDSITPPPSSSPTSYTHDRPWDRQAPSPLPSPIVLHPPGAPPDGLLALPQTKQPTKSTSTPVLSHTLAKFKEEEFRHSPLATDDGAVSPALSTSSKTDLFFAAPQSSELPRPPKALPNASSLGRSASLLREREKDRASTAPNTPAGASTPTFQESESGNLSNLARSESLNYHANHLPAESSSMGRTRSNTRDRSTGWRSVSSPSHSVPPTPPRQPPYPPRSPLATALHVVPDAMIMDEMTDMLPSPTRPSASFSRRESHLAREVRNVPKEYSLQPGMILEPVDGPDPFDPTTPPQSYAQPHTNGSSNKDNTPPHDAWKLERKLGEGAFSAVWAASSGNRLSAVKLTSQHPHSTSNTDQTLMRTHVSFLREKSVLRRISHSGIVSFIDSFSTETHHCLVLERISGGELFEYVADEVLWKRSITPSPPLSAGFQVVHDPTGEGFVKRVFGELCEAVGWLHSVGVVHRDIKLENILLTMNPFALPPTPSSSIPLAQLPQPPAPLIKLTDFGLSRFINPQSPLLETRCGSESFAAPEIIMGRPYDGRSTDSWACGVVLYTLLTGLMPFDEPPPPSSSFGGAAGGNTTGTTSSTLEGRARGSSVSSVASTGSTGMHEEKERRRRIMRIAKGQYCFPAFSTASMGARAIVERLLVRDPKKRASVEKDIWEMEWWAQEPVFAVPQSSAGEEMDMHVSEERAQGQGVARRVGNGVIYEGGLEEGLYGDID